MQVRRGVIKAFEAATYAATVRVTGSLSVWLERVPVSRGLPVVGVVAGCTGALLLFDDGNPRHTVVSAVYA